MQIFDISPAVSSSFPVWEGDPPVIIQQVMDMDQGEVYNLTRLDISAHTATHVDAPRHFLPAGRGVDLLDLGALLGPAWVAQFDGAGDITPAALARMGIPPGTQRLLFKTGNSRLWRERPGQFVPEFSGLSAEAAEVLLQAGVRLVGIDYLSIESYASIHAGCRVHHLLLGAGVVILEGLDLSAVEPGLYDLACLPLKLVGADGAPARAVLTRP